MPADAAWPVAEATSRSVDLSLSRIRDCAGLASLMKSADPSRIRLPQLKELARQVAMLETVMLELACEHRIEELA